MNNSFKNVLLASMLFLSGCGNQSSSSSSVPSSTPVVQEETIVGENSIASVRGLENDSTCKVEGVVAQVLYGQSGLTGYYLVDSTSSIYVYDYENVANIKVGNKVKVTGKKTTWIQEKEVTLAAQFGYQGAIQIASVESFENDNEIHSIPKQGIKKSTIDEMLHTPFTTNITSEVFEVNAICKKKQEPGFVNYYFYDLDNKTGTYTYTQNNGSDFKWLDAYDGKVVSMYLACHNVKCSGTGTNYRFQPVSINGDYSYTNKQIVSDITRIVFAKQFESSYSANPEASLISSYDSEALKANGITCSYTSTSDLVSFTNNVFNVTIPTTPTDVKVTINGSYNGETSSEEVTIHLEKGAAYNTISVEEAVDLGEDEEVTLKGVVASTITNNGIGFYIVDNTGTMAVFCKDKEEADKVSIGNEVVIKGTTDKYNSSSTSAQRWFRVKDAEVLYTDYKNHELDTSTFIDATISSLLALGENDEVTNNVYKVRVKINKVATKYYTNFYVVDPTDSTKSIILYASNGENVWGAKLNDYDQKVVDIYYCHQIYKNGKWSGYLMRVVNVVE